MQDHKSMSIPMNTNLTKLCDSSTSSQNVDFTLYIQLIGSLMYLVHMRPDIYYTVNALSQFMSNTYGLRVTSSSGVMLSGYTDSDWVGSAIDRKSTSSYFFSMGSAVISWSSKKQGSIAQSIVEAEYIGASDA